MVLLLSDESSVAYTQPECSNGEIVTDKLIYTTTLTLSPSVFNEPGRVLCGLGKVLPGTIPSPIYSDDPPAKWRYIRRADFLAGVPTSGKDGQPFINSSPGCFPQRLRMPGKPYYVDFAGVDDDGDSLVYSLTTPLNTP